MKVLHICRDFVGSKVHSELYQHLDILGIEQVVYSAYRDPENKLYNINAFESSNSEFLYRPILKLYHRVCFYLKSWKTIRDIQKLVDFDTIDVIHAVTLFTDGAVGAYLSRKYKKPLIVAVRNTDFNDFVKHAPHLWLVHRAVIRQASSLVFITDRLRGKFLSNFTTNGLKDQIRSKSFIQPNGINHYWLENLTQKSPNNHNVIYIGNFEYNKNVVRLINVIASLKSSYPDIHLDIAGGGGWQEDAVIRKIEANKDIVTYHGKVYDKDRLRSLYNNASVFCMASFHETFGLVYIEAMTQGLNVIFSKNEGIDGVFEKNVGIAVDPASEEEIKKAIASLFEDKSKFDCLTAQEFTQFDWNVIAQRYINIYKSFIK